MSQKKPTTNQQLEEMRAMIANLEPAKVITIDRELQQRNTTLMLMLYGATAKFGIGTPGSDGVLVMAQVPALQVPANQSLQWEVSEDGKSVMLYIVLNEPAEDHKLETSPAEGAGEQDAPNPDMDVAPPAPTPIATMVAEAVDEETALVGDEFEDKIEVGLGD